MAELLIRQATLQDAYNIARVHVAAWQETYHGIMPQPYLDSLDVKSRADAWVSRLSQENCSVFVAATQDGQICGFISGGCIREPLQNFDAEFYGIYLLSAVKGQGIGKLLMYRLAETLRTDGFTKAMLWVLADNPARGFYERLGGQQINQKTVLIGGVDLLEISYGWCDLQALKP